MKIISKFLTGKPIRRVSGKELEEIKKKQRFLNQHGIKVKVNGSWGPWQLKQYNNLTKPKQNWFTRVTLGAMMAENPSVATASGWALDSNGNYKQHQTPETDKLADNLAIIGETALLAPTLVGDLSSLYLIVRHPVLTAKAIPELAKNISWFARHPGALKVYHVNRFSNETFDLRKARTASSANVGLHVSPDPHSFEWERRSGRPVMEAYIPRADMETIDLGINDYNLLSNSVRKLATVGQYPNSSGLQWHQAAGDLPLLMKLLEKYGGNPHKVGKKLYLDSDVVIPLRNETWSNISPEATREAEQILSDASKIRSREDALNLNLRTSNLFSRNGKKVIKYRNANASETPTNNVSYMITDPNIFFIPNKDALNIGNDILGISRQGILNYGIYLTNH